MVDFTDVQEHRAQRTISAADLARSELQRRVATEITGRMERLLTADEWQTFTALVEQRIAQAERLKASAHERLETEPLTGDELEKAVRGIWGLARQIDAYRDVLTIPQRLAAESAP